MLFFHVFFSMNQLCCLCNQATNIGLLWRGKSKCSCQGSSNETLLMETACTSTTLDTIIKFGFCYRLCSLKVLPQFINIRITMFVFCCLIYKGSVYSK